MLVYQASRSLAIWTKSEISSDAMFLAAQKALDI
jgi:shikimate 5-dehydrogenase